MKTIVVTGPESTGKTVISSFLAENLGWPWIPEFARDYVSGLDRPYNYSDLVLIAENQIAQRVEAEKNSVSFLILDTWLIITKVWFLEVFNTCPDWLDSEISKYKIDLFLICKPDIPWVPDPLRENGGEKRDYLMLRYIEEIKKTGSEYTMISGIGDIRNNNALLLVQKHFNLK